MHQPPDRMAAAAYHRPHIVLLPGAGFQPAHYEKLSVFLNARAFQVTRVALPTSDGSRPPTGTYHHDITAVRRVVEPLVERGSHVFMLMHGWSALPGCDALRGLTSSQRRREQLPGGVVRLFLMSAFIIEAGVSLWEGISERARTIDMMRDHCIFHDDGAWEFKDPAFAMFLDLDEAEQKEQTGLLRTFNLQAWHAKASYCAWKDVPSTYFATHDDLACPPYVQRMMIEGMRRAGARVSVVNVASAHAMHVRCPTDVSREIAHQCDRLQVFLSAQAARHSFEGGGGDEEHFPAQAQEDHAKS